MMNMNRAFALLTLATLLSGVAATAQSGDALYKSKCQSCHGATGTPNPSLAKLMNIKPVSDPDIQKLTADQMAAAVKNGKGKMKPVAGLTDAQIKDAVAYYRGLK
jgi:mono/diheme cytochrome c family protein